jgi:hypothetical protein
LRSQERRQPKRLTASRSKANATQNDQSDLAIAFAESRSEPNYIPNPKKCRVLDKVRHCGRGRLVIRWATGFEKPNDGGLIEQY